MSVKATLLTSRFEKDYFKHWLIIPLLYFASLQYLIPLCRIHSLCHIGGKHFLSLQLIVSLIVLQYNMFIFCGTQYNEYYARFTLTFFSSFYQSLAFLSNKACNICIPERKIANFMEGKNRCHEYCGTVIRVLFLILESVCISVSVAPLVHPPVAGVGRVHLVRTHVFNLGSLLSSNKQNGRVGCGLLGKLFKVTKDCIFFLGSLGCGFFFFLQNSLLACKIKAMANSI